MWNDGEKTEDKRKVKASAQTIGKPVIYVPQTYVGYFQNFLYDSSNHSTVSSVQNIILPRNKNQVNLFLKVVCWTLDVHFHYRVIEVLKLSQFFATEDDCLVIEIYNIQ